MSNTVLKQMANELAKLSKKVNDAIGKGLGIKGKKAKKKTTKKSAKKAKRA